MSKFESDLGQNWHKGQGKCLLIDIGQVATGRVKSGNFLFGLGIRARSGEKLGNFICIIRENKGIPCFLPKPKYFFRHTELKCEIWNGKQCE